MLTVVGRRILCCASFPCQSFRQMASWISDCLNEVSMCYVFQLSVIFFSGPSGIPGTSDTCNQRGCPWGSMSGGAWALRYPPFLSCCCPAPRSQGGGLHALTAPHHVLDWPSDGTLSLSLPPHLLSLPVLLPHSQPAAQYLLACTLLLPLSPSLWMSCKTLCYRTCSLFQCVYSEEIQAFIFCV